MRARIVKIEFGNTWFHLSRSKTEYKECVFDKKSNINSVEVKIGYHISTRHTV